MRTISLIPRRVSKDCIAGFQSAMSIGCTRAWNRNGMLLTYISALMWLRNPLERVRTYSRDRYGTVLTPTSFRGLLISATSRRLMNQVNIDDNFCSHANMVDFGRISTSFSNPSIRSWSA